MAAHNTEKSLWLIINRKVFDVTKFHKQHPGGAAVMLQMAGKDATAAATAAHKTSLPWNLMQEFIIGTIKKGDGATELAADDGGTAGSAKGSAAGSAKGSAAGSAKGSAKGSAAGSAKGDQLEGEEEEEEEETQLEGDGDLVIEEAKSADPPAKKSRQNDRIILLPNQVIIIPELAEIDDLLDQVRSMPELAGTPEIEDLLLRKYW